MDAIELNVGGHSQVQMSMAKHNDIRVDFRSSICNCLYTFVFQWDWRASSGQPTYVQQQSHHQVLATRLQPTIGRKDPGILCMLLKVLYYHYRKLLSENANNASSGLLMLTFPSESFVNAILKFIRKEFQSLVGHTQKVISFILSKDLNTVVSCTCSWSLTQTASTQGVCHFNNDTRKPPSWVWLLAKNVCMRAKLLKSHCT